MEIPAFPASRPLDMDDKRVLDPILALLQPRISELTFAGLFLFRKAHDYRLTMVKDALVILGKGYDGRDYFLPPLSENPAPALELLFEEEMELYGADEPFAERYLAGRGINLTEDRDSFDYLYLKEELATLPGSRYHKKKNRVNYFTARHRYEVEIFSADHLDQCLTVLGEWHKITAGGSASLDLEVQATTEGLNRAEELDLQGLVVLVDGIVSGFVIGELLNRETAVCHFEKAYPFMEGLSQLLNREFAARLFNDCRYVNREQDLGEPGLRNAKLGYHPVELVKKFRAQPHKKNRDNS